MAAPKRYRAAKAVVKVSIGTPDGNRLARIVRKGGSIPDGVDQNLLDALESRGLIEKIEDEAAEGEAITVGFDGPPAKGATRKTWEAFGAQLGLSTEEMAGLKTKPDLIEAANVAMAALLAEEDEGDDSSDSDETDHDSDDEDDDQSPSADD